MKSLSRGGEIQFPCVRYLLNALYSPMPKKESKLECRLIGNEQCPSLRRVQRAVTNLYCTCLERKPFSTCHLVIIEHVLSWKFKNFVDAHFKKSILTLYWFKPLFNTQSARKCFFRSKKKRTDKKHGFYCARMKKKETNENCRKRI